MEYGRSTVYFGHYDRGPSVQFMSMFPWKFESAYVPSDWRVHVNVIIPSAIQHQENQCSGQARISTLRAMFLRKSEITFIRIRFQVGMKKLGQKACQERFFW